MYKASYCVLDVYPQISKNYIIVYVGVSITILFIVVDEAKAVRAFTRMFVLTAAGNG